jgi:hypothetical protein
MSRSFIHRSYEIDHSNSSNSQQSTLSSGQGGSELAVADKEGRGMLGLMNEGIKRDDDETKSSLAPTLLTVTTTKC